VPVLRDGSEAKLWERERNSTGFDSKEQGHPDDITIHMEI
jgi:hypothetical protein